MGKQKGDGGRTKARPSSSSLAASLLPPSTPVVGFGGYVGSSRLETTLSGEDPVPYSDVDSELAVHLKRLARKDPTTKLKALSALSTLLEQKSGKDVLLAFPQWAFEYKRLLLDYNREVRRATSDTMAKLVVSVGRDVAPHLKSLMGPWWFSQFDSYSEAAQAAKRSFQAAFPASEKRLDALILCTNEIFMYLEENLKLTPKDLADKASAEDELEEMHQQVVSSSLLALATLLDVLISSRAEKVGFENIPAESKHATKARGIAISFAEKLFSCHKCFIDFFKSRSSAIRSAAYSLLRSYIENVQHVFNEGNVRMLSAVVLGAFQENNPSCHSSMWEAMLLFLKRFPDCWTYVNVQKIVLSRFWHFLSNGCFGSQKFSYPALVLFLDSVPPKVINAERFFQEFFQNMWIGKTSSLSSNVERIAFFNALRECFLWALQNASRYSGGEDTTCHFRVTLVEHVVIKLLWGDFTILPHQQNQQRVITGVSSRVSEDTPATEKRNVETPKYPSSYSHELGRSIVDILSSITRMEYDLLRIFALAFQESCKEMLVLENGEASIKRERLVQFLFVLERYALRKGETWPLVYIIRPTLSVSFATLESLESTHAVQFLSAAVSVFGAREVVHVLSGCYEGSSSSNSDKQKGLDYEDFINIFKQRFVPWGLSRNDNNTAARIAFLIALLDEECFPDQWNSIISYVINRDVPGSAESGYLALLSVLLKEARGEIAKRNVDNQASYMSRWHHKLLDSTAVAVSCSSPPFEMAAVDFLCSAIGCSTEEGQVIYLSKEAFILIYKEMLKKLVGCIVGSSFMWVRQAGSLLTVEATNSELQGLSSNARIENARFALDVLSGSLYGLSIVEEDSELVSNIIAAIFLMSWECSMVDLLDGVSDYELENMKGRSELSDTLHALLSKVSNRLCQRLSADCREKMRIILAMCIRSAIFSNPNLDANKSTSLCFKWLLAVLDFLCSDQYEVDHLLEQLLYKGSDWPLWISENSLSGLASQKRDNIVTATKVSGSQKFISLLDKLILERGIEAVFRRAVSHSSSSDVTMENHAWLAAEILSTWEWPGGSSLTSFLPLLCSYAKNEMHYLQDGGVLDTTVGILLDAALTKGKSEVKSDSHVLLSSADEVGHIEEPFLRALLSLLTRLFKDNIWLEDKARSLFELLMSKLLTGETVNINCLRILPPIMSVLVQTLYGSASGYTDDARSLFLRDDDQVQTAITGWLERTLTYPPLSIWQVGLDTEEWFQLVMSCYPLDVTDRRTAPMSERKISSRERTLLLELFRKQNHGMSTPSSSTSDNSQLGPMMLSKLIVISAVYCGEDFSQEDWTFVLTQVRSWIQSAVVMMEDVAENVNDLVTHSSTGNDLETVVRKLEDVVLVKDRSRVHLAESALLAFSCFSRFPQPMVSSESDDPTNQIAERWGTMKDRIVEGTLRIFLSTGLAEAIASSYSPEAASAVSSSRMSTLFFWKLVAWSAIQSPSHCRERAIKSIDFWALSKGAIGSLYSILFSSKPVASLQYAAYVMLSTEPVSVLAIGEDTGSTLDPEDQDSSSSELLSEQNVHLRKEISCMLEMSPTEILQKDLLEPERVHILLAWSVFLSHLWSLPLSSPARERFVQCIQNSVNPVIIDCLFQYIFLELDMAPNFRKRDKELPAGVTEAVNAANEAIATGSVAGLVESLWPVDLQKMTSLSGAIFGMMLCLLPAYVRGWFNNIRDRSAQSAIETFTKTWCSPPLIANELSQIKKASFVDDHFSVSVSKAANEVVATYTKDETSVDLVIRLPSSYPLREVSVNCTKSLGISELKQRKWLMSMVLFLSNQNGALAEAIRIWKCNFDKAFEGVEDCPICYSVIHTANHTLPRVACKTCKHKYHSACLYKWFSTSNKRNCPLCQSLF